MREISVDLPAFGKPTSPTSASSFSSRRSRFSFARAARLVLGGRLVRGGGEARVARAAASAARHHEALRRPR